MEVWKCKNVTFTSVEILTFALEQYFYINIILIFMCKFGNFFQSSFYMIVFILCTY
jgi:hypothetical protein